MTIRCEANPPMVAAGGGAIDRFLDRVDEIAGRCDAVHLTENVLGQERISPADIGHAVQRRNPGVPVTASLRVRDKTGSEIDALACRYADAGFSGILVLMGDPAQSGRPDTGQTPSAVAGKLKDAHPRLDIYLSAPRAPDFAKMRKKMDVGPAGFMTQVVFSIGQVQRLADGLAGFSVVPIVLYPSQKNSRAAEFLGIDMGSYGGDFEGFVRDIHGITGDLMITSPNDFAGMSGFLDRLAP